MTVEAKTAVDSAFERVVDDKIYRRQFGQDVACDAGRAPVREHR